MHGTKDWVVVLSKPCWDTGMEERVFSSQSSAYKVCNYWLSNSMPQELSNHGMVIGPMLQYQTGLGIAISGKILQRCLRSFKRLQLALAVMYFVL